MSPLSLPAAKRLKTTITTTTALDNHTSSNHSNHSSSSSLHWKLVPPVPEPEPGDTVFVRPESLSTCGFSTSRCAFCPSHHRVIYLGPDATKQSKCQIIVPTVSTIQTNQNTNKNKNDKDHRQDEPQPQPQLIKKKRLLPIFNNNVTKNPNSAVATNTNTTTNTTVVVVVVSNTESYRQLAASQVTPDDRVLEIGCSTGQASEIILLRGSPMSWVAFDTSPDMVAKTRDRIMKLQQKQQQQQQNQQQPVQTTTKTDCQVLNVLLDPEKGNQLATQFLGREPPTVVFVDIGGNREETGVVRVLEWVLQLLSTSTTSSSSSSSPKRPHLVVCKSSNMFYSISSLLKKVPVDKQKKENKATIVEGEIAVDHDDNHFHVTKWFHEQVALARRECIPKHPLAAPKVYVPLPPQEEQQQQQQQTEQQTEQQNHHNNPQLICRYHNYFAKGCAKGKDCPYNHDYCHLCVTKGHIARNCPLLLEQG